jgi:hypothetical protein
LIALFLLPHRFPTVASTSTWFTLRAGGALLQLRFTTPHLPQNLEVAARPGTYIVFNVSSADGADHDVQVYLDTSAEVVCAGPGQTIEWDRPALLSGSTTGRAGDGGSGITALRLGQTGQREGPPGAFNFSARMRNSTEPNQRQDYGFVYLLAADADNATNGAVSSVITAASAAQAAFVRAGVLPGPTGDARPPSMLAASINNTVAALAWNLGKVPASGAPVAVTGVFFVDVGGAYGLKLSLRVESPLLDPVCDRRRL